MKETIERCDRGCKHIQTYRVERAVVGLPPKVVIEFHCQATTGLGKDNLVGREIQQGVIESEDFGVEFFPPENTTCLHPDEKQAPSSGSSGTIPFFSPGIEL